MELHFGIGNILYEVGIFFDSTLIHENYVAVVLKNYVVSKHHTVLLIVILVLHHRHDHFIGFVILVVLCPQLIELFDFILVSDRHVRDQLIQTCCVFQPRLIVPHDVGMVEFG